MPFGRKDENLFTDEEFALLFGSEEEQEPSPAKENNPEGAKEQAQDPDGHEDVTKTQAFAKRLRESTDKARNEERESIAKELGYASYKEMKELLNLIEN